MAGSAWAYTQRADSTVFKIRNTVFSVEIFIRNHQEMYPNYSLELMRKREKKIHILFSFCVESIEAVRYDQIHRFECFYSNFRQKNAFSMHLPLPCLVHSCLVTNTISCHDFDWSCLLHCQINPCHPWFYCIRVSDVVFQSSAFSYFFGRKARHDASVHASVLQVYRYYGDNRIIIPTHGWNFVDAVERNSHECHGSSFS